MKLRKYLTLALMMVPLAYCHPVPADDFLPFELNEELECLTVALYHEARGSDYDSLLSVATVIMNRVESNKYPDNVCDVVNQPYQFSYVNQGKPETYTDIVQATKDNPNQYDVISLQHSLDVAQTSFNKTDVPFGEDVLYYHADHILPYWTAKLTMVDIIGEHIFWSL